MKKLIEDKITLEDAGFPQSGDSYDIREAELRKTINIGYYHYISPNISPKEERKLEPDDIIPLELNKQKND